MVPKIGEIDKKTYLTLACLFLIGYGFLICTTNRTEYHLFINMVSLPRIGLGAIMTFSGWTLLLLLYGVKKEKRPKKARRKRK